MSITLAMNNPLRELFEKAYGYPPAPVGEPEAQRFAELIILECANLIQKPDSYEETYLSIAATKIKQHFGVRE